MRKVVLLLVIQGVIGAVVLSRYRVDSDAYVAATIDKHARLEQLSGGRLILVGGSNVAMGLSAKQLSGATGRPAVNMGVHANLGRDFMLAEVQGALREGDVVVLSPEYQLFDRDPHPGTLMQLLELRPASRAFVPRRSASQFTDEGLVLLGERVRRVVIGGPRAVLPYARGAFNEHGDAVAHHGLPPRRPLAPFYFERLDDAQIARAVSSMARFAADAKERGARVLLTYPPLPQALFDKHRDAIGRIEAALAAEPSLSPINAPHTLPDACFFDTAYHLTRACAALRSEEIARAVQAPLALAP